MSKNRTRGWATTEEGFTLIELLVVVLIIGILGAIAIPAFVGQRQRAQDQAAKSLVRNGIIAAETYYTDNGGTNFAGMLPALLTTQEQNIQWVAANAKTVDNQVQVAIAGPANQENSYALSSESKTGKWFIYIRSDAGVGYRCTGTAPPAASTTSFTGCTGAYAGSW